MKSPRIERATKKVLCWIMMIGGSVLMFGAGFHKDTALGFLGAGHVIYGFVMLTNQEVMK